MGERIGEGGRGGGSGGQGGGGGRGGGEGERDLAVKLLERLKGHVCRLGRLRCLAYQQMTLHFLGVRFRVQGLGFRV